MTTPTHPPIPCTEEPETLAPGLQRFCLHEGRIVVLRGSGTSHQAVDAWAAAVKELFEGWQTGEELRLIHDFSGATLTPYAAKRAREVTGLRPELGGRIAVIVSRSALGHIIRIFVNRTAQKTARERRVFFDIDEALKWLAAGLPPAGRQDKSG